MKTTNRHKTTANEPGKTLLIYPIISPGADSHPVKILDYAVSSLKLANPNGKMPAKVTGCKLMPGPGKTIMGNLERCLLLGPKGKASVSIANSNISLKLFTVRICFRAAPQIKSRQNLVESDILPFAMYIERAAGKDRFELVASIGTAHYGWTAGNGALTAKLKSLSWYVADLVFNVDTVSLFVNNKREGVLALPQGELMSLPGSHLYIGTGTDGKKYHFSGEVAGLQLYYNTPADLLVKADETRNTATWYISNKYLALGGVANLGYSTGVPEFSHSVGAFIQNFEKGQIQLSGILGVAFAMQGAIWRHYKSLAEDVKKELEFLVSDELQTSSAQGYKNLFRKGGIYSSPNFGTSHVTGQIFVDFESMGETNALGFPQGPATAIDGGLMQVFEGSNIYLKDGAPKSFAVSGDLLKQYETAGGPAKLGFPIGNNVQIIQNGNAVGWVSYFEFGAIYSTFTGTFDMSGGVKTMYDKIGGPSSALGLPTSGLTPLPSGAGTFTTFEQGTIVTLDATGNTFTCTPFQIRLGRVDTKDEDGFGAGENDLTIDAYIDGLPGGSYHKRFPDEDTDDYYSDQNIVDINTVLDAVIVPNDPNLNIVFRADVWDIDGNALINTDNDLIGNYSHALSIDNAWGLAQNDGIFDESEYRIKHITWSLIPKIDPATLTDGQRWWGVKNSNYDPITHDQYASAFSNVDSEYDWYDVSDWLAKLFYELVIKDLAKHGRCAGMCIEAILSWKFNSLFGLPLNRFTDMNITGNEFVIKHQRQVSELSVWWFIGQFLSGNTHDPKSVFEDTQAAFDLGQNPVICLAQKYDFSGAPHVVLPHAWEKNGDSWRIHIYDPYFPTPPDGSDPTRFIEIDASGNNFNYVGTKNLVYKGSTWTGGRLYFLPWAVVAERARTPVWEAVLLLVAGTIVVLGGDGQTDSLTDTNGNQLDFTHPDVTSLLKAGQPIDHRFFAYKGFGGSDDPVAGSMFLRTGINTDTADVTAPGTAVNSDFIHKVSGNQSDGQFQYVIKSFLTEIKITCPLATDEQITVGVKNIHKRDHTISLGVSHDKTMSLEITNKLSTGKDHIHLVFDQLPVSKNKDLTINPRPGLGGLDIMPSTGTIKTTVTVESGDNRHTTVSKYPISSDGGIRIRHSTLATEGELLVSKIDKLFGPARDLRTVKNI